MKFGVKINNSGTGRGTGAGTNPFFIHVVQIGRCDMSSYADYSAKTPPTPSGIPPAPGGTPQKTGDEIQKGESKRILPRKAQLKKQEKEALRKDDTVEVEKSDKKAEQMREQKLPTKSEVPAPSSSSSSSIPQLRARPSFSEDDEETQEEMQPSKSLTSSSSTSATTTQVPTENDATQIIKLCEEKRNLKLIVDNKEGNYNDHESTSAYQELRKIDTELKQLGKLSPDNMDLIKSLHDEYFGTRKIPEPPQRFVSKIPEEVVSRTDSALSSPPATEKTDFVAKSKSSPFLNINMAERQKVLKEKGIGKKLFAGAATTPPSTTPSSASPSTKPLHPLNTPEYLEFRKFQSIPILKESASSATSSTATTPTKSSASISSTSTTSTSWIAKESENEEMDISEEEEATPLQKKPDKKAHDEVEKSTKLTKEEETAQILKQVNSKKLDFFKDIDKSSDTKDRFKACDTLDRLALLIAEKHMTSEVIENLQSIAKKIKSKINSLSDPTGQTKSEAQERLEKTLAIYQNKLNPLRKSLLLESKDQFITNLKDELAKINNIELVCTRLNQLAEEITDAEVVISDDLSKCLTQVRDILAAKAGDTENDNLNTTIDIYNHLCNPYQDNLNKLDLLLQGNENFTSQNLPLVLDIAFHYTLLKSETSHVVANLPFFSILIEESPPAPNYIPGPPPTGDDETIALPVLPESSSEGELENNIDVVLDKIKQIYDKSDAKGKNLIIERLEFECSRIIIPARKNGPELWLTDNDQTKIKTFLANIKKETELSSAEKATKELKVKEKKQEKTPKKDALMHSLYGNDIVSYRNLPEVEDITNDLYNSMADLYSQIKPEELSQPNTCPSVQAMIDHAEQVTCWIMKSIYAGKTPKERGKIIEKFIRVQSQLIDKGDMLTASYIFNTFQNVCISGLLDSWKEVSKKVLERLSESNALFSPMGTFKNRRDYQQKLLDKEIPFIPDLMLHIKDAKVAEEVDAATAYRIRDKYGPLLNNVKQFKVLHAAALGQRNTTLNQVISRQIPMPKMLDKPLDALRKDKSLEENIT